MKLGVFILLLAFLTSPSWAQESAAQGDFGEVFGIARSGSSPWECETPEPLPATRAEWEAIAAKIESGDINKATVDAFISGKMPKDLHTEELGRKYHKAHYAYVRAKVENSSTGCEFDRYVVVPRTYNRSDVLNRVAGEDSLPTQEDLNAIWASMLEDIEKQREVKPRNP